MLLEGREGNHFLHVWMRQRERKRKIKLQQSPHAPQIWETPFVTSRPKLGPLTPCSAHAIPNPKPSRSPHRNRRIPIRRPNAEPRHIYTLRLRRRSPELSSSPRAAASTLPAFLSSPGGGGGRMAASTARTVKDVNPHEFVKAYSAHLKRSGKVTVPDSPPSPSDSTQQRMVAHRGSQRRRACAIASDCRCPSS
jgi:hypothetical protein